MKICYDQGCNGIRVVIATKWRYYLFYLQQYISALGTVLRKSFTGAFSSNSSLDVHEVSKPLGRLFWKIKILEVNLSFIWPFSFKIIDILWSSKIRATIRYFFFPEISCLLVRASYYSEVFSPSFILWWTKIANISAYFKCIVSYCCSRENKTWKQCPEKWEALTCKETNS